MRHAYALLGILFIIVFGGAYLLVERAEAPEMPEVVTNSNNQDSIPMTLSSEAFSDGEFIPAIYTCDGDNISPPLTINDVPDGAKSLVLVMDDPDIPTEIKADRGIEKFDHWVLYNLPADTTDLPPGPAFGSDGLNSRGEPSYTGPCPPSEYEPTTHRYNFRLYALSDQLVFDTAPTLAEVEEAIQGMIIETAELTGLYTRVAE